MQANDFELESAIRNIVGIWHALGTPLKFKYQITKDEEGLWLNIDGNKMKVLKLTPYPLLCSHLKVLTIM